MKKIYLDELKKLVKFPYVEKKYLQEVKEFLVTNQNVTKPENPSHHLGLFIVPIHLPSKRILLVHHKKANSWIPPGGHIDLGEDLLDTLKREFQEELHFKLTDEKMAIFDSTLIHLEKPQSTCKVHYDFWSVVYMKDVTNFSYEASELNDMKWYSFDDALAIMTHRIVLSVLRKLFSRL